MNRKLIVMLLVASTTVTLVAAPTGSGTPTKSRNPICSPISAPCGVTVQCAACPPPSGECLAGVLSYSEVVVAQQKSCQGLFLNPEPCVSATANGCTQRRFYMDNGCNEEAGVSSQLFGTYQTCFGAAP